VSHRLSPLRLRAPTHNLQAALPPVARSPGCAAVHDSEPSLWSRVSTLQLGDVRAVVIPAVPANPPST